MEYQILFNTLRPRQNGWHFADDTFRCVFMDENVWILINISLNFVPKGPINNIPALVQIMAWRRPGDKPLSERQAIIWTNDGKFTDTYMHHSAFSELITSREAALSIEYQILFDSLSHPSLGWLYVFSSIPPPRPPSAAAAAMTFASQVKTVWARP